MYIRKLVESSSGYTFYRSGSNCRMDKRRPGASLRGKGGMDRGCRNVLGINLCLLF